MDPTDPKGVAPGVIGVSPKEALGRFFGGYRAEWLKEQLFELFTEPSYFPELLTERPCVLMGGRGTGKTTVLRALSYDGQYKLRGERDDKVADWPFFGCYYRVNTNRVAAFSGTEATEDEWGKLFAHYLNLELCDLTVRFLQWFEQRTGVATLTVRGCEHVGASLNLSATRTLQDLGEALAGARISFEAYLNNIADGARPPLSMQGAPIDVLTERLQAVPVFRGKPYFFLIDEYENFLDYQQRIVNTLLKHSGGTYSFKIGVKELGWRARATVNPYEQLISPADYVLVDIGQKLDPRFEEFAAKVCGDRLTRVGATLGYATVLPLSELLPGLTEEEEGIKLGAKARWSEVQRDALGGLAKDERDLIDALSPLECLFIYYWAEKRSDLAAQAFRERLAEPQQWLTRYNNYRYAFLFQLKRGQVGIRKYYSGWPTLVRLAAGNIRYILELVEQSLLVHIDEGQSLQDPVTPEVQTRAAEGVGKKNLSELEGLTVQGARLTRLLLGLGRVFQVLAAEPLGHTPEVNHFALSREPGEGSEATQRRMDTEQLLTQAVMHLALVRFPGNKLQDQAEIRDYDYMPHPVFAPFFVFSYRRKRKIALSEGELWGLTDSVEGTRTIRAILERQNRNPDEPLPEQLRLFGTYYARNS